VVCLNECDRGTSKRRPRPTAAVERERETEREKEHTLRCWQYVVCERVSYDRKCPSGELYRKETQVL
jgi:hypothetical protein